MTIVEAAQYLGIPPSTLQRWAWDGVGPKTIGQRRHNNVQYDQKDLDAWLREQGRAVSSMIGA